MFTFILHTLIQGLKKQAGQFVGMLILAILGMIAITLAAAPRVALYQGVQTAHLVQK